MDLSPALLDDNNSKVCGVCAQCHSRYAGRWNTVVCLAAPMRIPFPPALCCVLLVLLPGSTADFGGAECSRHEGVGHCQALHKCACAVRGACVPPRLPCCRRAAPVTCAPPTHHQTRWSGWGMGGSKCARLLARYCCSCSQLYVQITCWRRWPSSGLIRTGGSGMEFFRCAGWGVIRPPMMHCPPVPLHPLTLLPCLTADPGRGDSCSGPNHALLT